MISSLQHMLLSLAVLCSTFLPTHLWAAPDLEVTASVTFQDGTILQYQLPRDTQLDIGTSIGDLTFSCDRIASIDTPAGTDLTTVMLVSGERWRAVIKGNPLRAIGLRKTEADIDLHGDVRRIRFSASETQYCTPPHHMKLLLEDGSQALITPAGLLLPVESEYGKFDLPVAALRALKFLASTDGDDPDIALVRFPTGHVERLQVRSRFPCLRTRDCHGNKLKIYHRDIMGILNPVELSGATTANQQGIPNTSHVTTEDGENQDVSIPLAVWVMRTGLGKLSFPSPLVHSIRRLPDDPSEVELRTVFGEVLTGELMASKLRIRSKNGEGHSDIDFDDVVELTTSSPALPIPDEWLTFYLTSGMAVVGRLAGTDSGLAAESDEELPSRMVYSLTPTPEDTFVAASKSGKVRVCRAATREASVVLLSNGATISLPWNEIYLAKIQQKVDETKFSKLQERGERKDDGSVPLHKEEGDLRLDTAIGTLELRRADVASVLVDRDASLACVNTIHGDALFVSVPSRRWFEKLEGGDDYEFPDETKFKITLRDIPALKATAGSVVCRLTSGDILYGRLEEQELNIRQEGSRGKATPIRASRLTEISSEPGGSISFSLQSGATVVGDPKERTIGIELSSTGTTNNIPFKAIESLVASSRELPPTTVFRAGLPPRLTGEVLIEGGIYAQGSESGMDDERPIHNVSLSAFLMDSTEVTRAQFSAFIKDSGHETAAELVGASTTWRAPGFVQRQDAPVVCVSWTDAAAYCNWRSKQTGLTQCYIIEKDGTVTTDAAASGYRLPTEAEWEYAARARGRDLTYPWENSPSATTGQPANYRQKSQLTGDGWEWTNPAKSFPANKLGVFGLGGNVWEWCEDWYFERAYSALQNTTHHNPCTTLDSAAGLTRRVMRGGSFRNGLDLLRCTSRGSGLPYAFSNHVGFRCVRNAD